MQRVHRALVAGIGVDRGHEAALDADRLVQHVGDRRQAVGGAGGVGDHGVLGGQLVVVDAVDHGEVRAGGRGRDQDPLGAALEVGGGLFLAGEDAGALQHDVDPEVAPGQLGRVAFGQDLDLLAVDADGVFRRFDGAGEGAVHRIVLQQMAVGLGRAEVVDRHELYIVAPRLHGRAEHQASNPPEAVDAYPDRHSPLLFMSIAGPLHPVEVLAVVWSVPSVQAA